MPGAAELPSLHKSSKEPHVGICVMNAKGHIQPGCVLANKLSRLGLSVTVICPDRYTHSLLSGYSFTGDVKLEVLMESHTEPPSRTVMKGLRRSYYTASDLTHNFLILNAEAFQLKLESLLNRFKSSGSPLSCLIVDMLFTWTQPVLRKLNIPKYILYTAAATHIAMTRHSKALYENKLLPLDGEDRTACIQIPGIPALRWQDIPDLVRDPLHPFHSLDWDEHMFDAEGILLNTCVEVEGRVIHAIRNEIPRAKSLPLDKLFTVGPLIPESCFSSHESLGSLSLQPEEERRCVEFLNSQPKSSVVYISFGSMTLVEEAQALELAAALENSGKRFLWVLPTPSELPSALPEGFEERMEGRGIVMSNWAPQKMILRHPAVGGFVTHCGWNSVMECIVLGGVPMLCWPFTADQPVTCRMLVEEVKIAVEVQGADLILNRDEIEKGIRSLMEGPEPQSMRMRARRLKLALHSSVLDEFGSSNVNLREFVHEIHARASELLNIQ